MLEKINELGYLKDEIVYEFTREFEFGKVARGSAEQKRGD